MAKLMKCMYNQYTIEYNCLVILEQQDKLCKKHGDYIDKTV